MNNSTDNFTAPTLLIYMNLCSSQRRPLLEIRAGLLPAFLAAGIVLLAGCGKKPETAGSSNQPTPEPVTAISPGPVLGSAPRVVPVAVAEGADASAQLAQLTQVLRRFGVEKRRVPQSLGEIVAAGYLTALPAAPAGKQFAIDGKRMQVVLANK